MNLVRNMNSDKVMFDFLVNFEEPVAFEEELKARGSWVIRLAGRRKHPWRHYKDYQTFFRKYGKAYDGIYCNMLSLANIDDLHYSKTYGIPRIIVHAHNSLDSGWDILGIRGRLHLLHQKTLQKYADVCFACSRQAGQWMFGMEAHYEVIHNAIDMERFRYDPERRKEIRNQWNISPDTVVYGTVGRLDVQKNPLFLPEVFYHIRESHGNCIFLHVGDGALRGEMEKKIRQYGLEGSYRLEGTCDDSAEYYQVMDAFLFPSFYEGLGISLIEAQACDLPCFVSQAIPAEARAIEQQYISLSLDAGSEAWAREILKFMARNRCNRKERTEEIRRAGYDIKEVSRMMEERLYDG